ncbi:MAG: hypothetical protein K6G66_04325, partial [Oscillospiraceae bacterium]|nr:hypothetical protein [Oscillospiraceae bacterium]
MSQKEQFVGDVKYSDVARAISRDFFRVFCINTDTNVYVEFTPHAQDEALDVRTVGENFQDVVLRFLEATYAPDLDMVRAAFTKQNVLGVLDMGDSFSLDFRMLLDGKPAFVRLKATRLNPEDPSRILVALRNNDAHMQRLATYENGMSKELSFTAVSEALTSDYACIFYVNTRTNEYIEYSSNDRYKSLAFPSSGKDFFAMCREDFARIVFAEDRDIFLRAMDRENLLKVLSTDRLFLLTFRVFLDNTPVYIR